MRLVPAKLDFDAIAVAPVTIFSLAASIIAIKAAAIFIAARLFRVPGTINAKSNSPQADRPWTLVTGSWTDGEVIRG